MDVLTYRFGDFATLTVSTNGKLDGLSRAYEDRIGKDRKVIYSFSENGELRFGDKTSPVETPADGKDGVYSAMPLIFEQPTYFFEVVFDESRGIDEKSIGIRHRLAEIADKFYRRGRSISGQLSFVNEPGKFRLEVEYKRGNVLRTIWAEFMVASTKMDVDNDYREILGQIEKEQRDLIFSPYAKTVRDVGTRKQAEEEAADRRWAVYFDAAFDEYERALKRILYCPHQKMVSVDYARRVGQVKRWTTSLAREYARVKPDKARLERYRFLAPEYEMTYDTPENRFVKYTLKELTRNLIAAEKVIREDDRYSAPFKTRMAARVAAFQRYLREPVMQRIGEMRGMTANSLVLQMRPGYAEIRAIWQVMHSFFTTDVNLGKNLSVGYASIALLYEYWCFMMVRQIVEGVLGIRGRPGKDKAPDYKRYFDGSAADEDDPNFPSYAYIYEKDGEKWAEVIYQQSYGDKSAEGYSSPDPQRPDIVLRLFDKNGVAYTYLFDAKYRISTKAKGGRDYDAAPRDALDQMHRYRDAILWRNQDKDGVKSLQVIGAYILFPADEDGEGRVYPYEDLMLEQNIGAFPLLPGKMKKLTEHIKTLVTDRVQFAAPDLRRLKSDVLAHKGLSYVIGEGIGEGEILEEFVDVPMWEAVIKTSVCPIAKASLDDKNMRPELVKMIRLKATNKTDVLLKVVSLRNQPADTIISSHSEFRSPNCLGGKGKEDHCVFEVARNAVPILR